MSEKTTTKRYRDHDGATQVDPTKRHRKPINTHQPKPDLEDFDSALIPILTIPSNTQDLSYLFTNLSPGPFLESDPDTDPTGDSVDEDKESVIRHLLEASDDELGLPKVVDSGGDDDVAKGYFGDFEFGLSDGLWELEDEAANYYTLLQSGLFMQ